MLLLSSNRSNALQISTCAATGDLNAAWGSRFHAFPAAERAGDHRDVTLWFEDDGPLADRRAEEEAERWDGLG